MSQYHKTLKHFENAREWNWMQNVIYFLDLKQKKKNIKIKIFNLSCCACKSIIHIKVFPYLEIGQSVRIFQLFKY